MKRSKKFRDNLRSNLTSRPLPAATEPVETYAHFRLCHVCWYLNESGQEVMKCDRCHRYLSSASNLPEPSLPNVLEEAYADFETSEAGESRRSQESDDALEGSVIRLHTRRKARSPLSGLTAVW